VVVRIFVRSVFFACAFFLFSETAGATLAAPKKKETAEAVKPAPKKKETAGPAKSVPQKASTEAPKKKETAKAPSADSKKKDIAGKAQTAAKKDTAASTTAVSKTKEAVSKTKEAAAKTASKAKEKASTAAAALKKKMKSLPPPGLSGIASVYVYKKRSRSASGEFINFKTMVAAHRTFRFGTKVKVTNRRNGKSVIVRIIDRGPFIRGRVIDLSPAAAREIGMGWGIAPVTLAVMGKA
jgi:rare lipoprotein A